MFNLCQYSNLFGPTDAPIRSYRILGISMIDFGVVVLAGFLIYWLLNKYGHHIGLITVLAILFLTGIIAHRLFCVRTTVDKFLFPDG